MNEKSVIEDFIFESRKYITKSSIDNLLTKIGSDNFNGSNLVLDNVSFMYLSEEHNVYLVVCIKIDGRTHNYILKFDELSTLEYLLQKYEALECSMKNISLTESLVEYDESTIQYNGYQYSIIVIDYNTEHGGQFFYIVDSESREEVCSILYNVRLRIVARYFASLRFPNIHINQAVMSEKIPLDTLPKIIADQIIATTVKLSLL